MKITLRKLYREKLYTIINVSGLALGIACCLILGLFLHNELTYDQHHKNYKRIYRVVNTINGNKTPITSPALAPLLKKENPEIIDYVRFSIITLANSSGLPFYSGDKTFFWNNVFAADDNVFEVFTYDIIYGDPKTALVDPNSIAISETIARTCFGDVNPVGKTISTYEATMKISLVFADLPNNTHLKTNVLLSHNAPALKLNPTNLRTDLWDRIEDYTYLVLPENYPQESFKKMMSAFYNKYMKEIGEVENRQTEFWLQPLKDIHYNTEELLLDAQTGNALYLYGSVVTGLLILLVACINYMNLATASSSKRGREVGIQRVMGAKKSQLIMQFMGESIVIVLMALFFGMIIVELVLTLTPINELVGNRQLTDYIAKPVLLWWLFGATVFICVISGLYPAFYLSSISPIAAITALKRSATSQLKMRQILVLVQFIISIGVIASTFLMVFQMRYITNKPLGFEKENRVVARLWGADVLEKNEIIKMELLKNPNVKGMTLCNAMLGGPIGSYLGDIENNDGSMEQQLTKFISVYNDDYLDVMGLELIEGRNYSNKISTDTNKTVIVNEALVRKMGWDEPLDKRIQFGDHIRKVIGVVRDFHALSMRSSIEPLVLLCGNYDFLPDLDEHNRPKYNGMMVIEISGEDIPNTLDFIRNVIGHVNPGHTIKLEFLDEIIDQLYVFERQVIGLTGTFAGICVFICCLGLFGLSAFTTEQRSKEIGVRKVVGASTIQIILMLFKPTVILVLIGAVIASASAYLVMERWLAGFAYKADINPLMFVMATLIVVIVAFVTIALQSLKTAHANPVEALRYE
ncbi:MAG: ABC transporter permease [Deltaproteobacteria bacterium]|nr:ABC transporter permease [Deltaproteobacteria bacterium]